MNERERNITKSVTSPDDVRPELDDAWFEEADAFIGDVLVRRGRPKSDSPKQPVSLRLDPEVVDWFRSRGPGWQTQINNELRMVAGLSAAPQHRSVTMTTSKSDASKASKLLRSKKSSAATKSVAGSDLSQAKRKASPKKKTK